MSENKNQLARIMISEDKKIIVPSGINLRDALKKYFSTLYNGKAQYIHCRGLGTCGTCSVYLEGAVSPPTAIEKWRLNFPPHKDSLAKGMRLACQCQVLGDITIRKGSGLWGNK